MTLLVLLALGACTGTVTVKDAGDTGPIDADGDGYTARIDCDDAAAAVHPSAAETCNGIDDDCDLLVDVDDPDVVGAPTWYPDADADSFGDPGTSTVACDSPVGWASEATDCDDARAEVNPAAPELCDGIDDDCDLLVDVDDPDLADGLLRYADGDGDGFGDPDTGRTQCAEHAGWVADPGDCDDADANVHPGAAETCDTIDDDCDGLLDDADPDEVEACDAPSTCSVTARSPARWALDVPAVSDITVAGDFDPTTLDDATFLAFGDVSGFLPGTVTFAEGRATFHPIVPARPGERVTALLTGDVRCADGEALRPVVWTWTAAVDGGSGVLADVMETETHVGYSYGIVAYDLDGDGDLEVATVDAEEDRVSILDGAPGAYTAQQRVDVSGYPEFLDGSDIDGDGDIDLLVVSDRLNVLRNDGSGRFADPVGYGSPSAWWSTVRAADMDGDGDLDAVVGTRESVVVFVNDGTGVFTPLVEAVIAHPFQLDVGDVDGDDDVDVIAPEGDGTVATVFLNDGTGELAASHTYTLAAAPKTVFIDDLDGDGDADAAIPTLYGDAVYTLTGDGSGDFSLGSMRLEGGHGVCGGDLDADGDLDLVVPRFGYHAIATFTNDGAAGFTRDQAFETGRNPTSVFCADLDGDGALDVLAAGGEGSNSSVIVALNTP